MKKLALVIIGCITSMSFASAQDQEGLFSVGANLNYGTKIESIGLGLRGQYGFTDRVRGSAEYKYYIDRHNLSEWEINTDLHYLFAVSPTVSLYPIAGVKFSRWTYDPDRSNGHGRKFSHNRVGLNIGFGGQVPVAEKLFLQFEAKEEVVKKYTQFVGSIGFMYQF